jgi:ubiquinone/menaquinone biosynthesis C-methylase UbiE
MEYTGERYVPAVRGQIYYEHLHRYAIASRFSAGKRVLDIASGEGYGAALLARTAAEVVGVDVDESTVEHARRTYYATNLRFLRGSVTEIPLGDASVDVVASFETIEHVAEQDRMLDELRRVLAPGGVIVLSSPNKLVYSDAPGFSNPFHIKELYFAELRDLLMRRFRHVALYGQRLSASSVVHPLAGGVSERAGWYNGSAERVGAGLPTLTNPVYFVAVCSDEPLAVDVSSAYVDAGDDLLEDIWFELNALRRQATASLGAPDVPAALPGSASRGVHGEPLAAIPAAAGDADRDRAQAQIDALDAELAAVREELAGARAELEAERARALADRDLELERARADGDAELAQAQAERDAEVARLRGRFEEETKQLAAAYDSRRANLQEQVELESERAGSLQRALADARAELQRGSDAVAMTSANLYEERARCERLIAQLAESRAAEQRGAAAEESVRLLNDRVLELTEALHRAEADSLMLREVLSSRFWKLTSPLRRAISLVRR